MANKMAALMDGVLQQHTGTGMSKKWTKGFWQQKDMKLIMYNSETELDQPQSEIDLEQVTAVTRINDPKKGPQFQLTAPKKTYLFLASSIEEVYFWVDRLTSLVEKKNSKPAAPATPSPAASTPAPAPPVSSPPVSPSIEISPAPRKGPPPRNSNNSSAAAASPLSSSAPVPGPISPREPAPVPPSQMKGTKSAIFSHDRPPPPPRNVAGSSLNVRANMPTSSPASPSSPTSGTSINPRPPPPRGPSAFSLNKPAPSPPTPTKDLSNGSNDDPDGASKSGKPPPPKRLPPKPPGISLDESEATTEGPPSPPSSPPPGAVPRPPLPNVKSKPDQTKKRLPPTPGQKPSDAEHADGEGTNEEPHAPIDEEKRMPIIKEIVSTEQTYVNNLNIALKKYMTPLLESCGPKDKDAAKRKEEVTSMFSNMEIIYGLNSELLKSLQECTECDPSSPKYLMVGDVFGRFTPFLKMYQQYSVGYEHAMEIFNKWTKDTVCVNLLKACNESTGTNLKLDHYLIFPIQRIPRYNLLLQDLIKHTPDNHPDKTKLQNALENNKKVAEHINSNLKQADNARKIVSAVAIDGLEQLMAPARYLIHHEKVEAARLDLAKYDFSRLTDIAKARAAPREKLQVFLFNNLFAVREDKVSLFGSSLTRANWVLPIQLWLKDDPGADTGLLFLGPHEGFYVNFPQAETRTAWIDSVAELSTGVDAYREFEYLSADERLYTGRWFAGKFDGVGTLYYYGNVYVGDWFSGLKQGNGKLTYSTGDVYDGQWENDMQNGEGTLTYAAGHTYIGEWRDGKRTGKGEMVFAEGKKYDGRWKDDLAFGVGVFTGCGVTYDGNWLNGKMHGKGTVEHPMYSYTGFFAKGKREGTGTCEWKDGSKYEGNWRDDKRTGMGKYTCESYVYDGEWANGKMEGKGKAEYSWGTYKGEWVQGTKSGKGSLSYNSGLNYEGTFKNDLFNGHGTVVYPNGYKWEGKFQNGLPEGKGTVSISMPNNINQKKATFVAVVKDREMTLSLGKEDVKCPVIPDVPVFDLDL